MTTDIRVGDRFLIEVTVSRLIDDDLAQIDHPGGEDGVMAVSILTAGKRLPRAIRVGDRVRVKDRPAAPGTCLAIDEGTAWLKCDGHGYATWPLTYLELCDEASS